VGVVGILAVAGVIVSVLEHETIRAQPIAMIIRFSIYINGPLIDYTILKNPMQKSSGSRRNNRILWTYKVDLKDETNP
jgi:hypothetical protein